MLHHLGEYVVHTEDMARPHHVPGTAVDADLADALWARAQRVAAYFGRGRRRARARADRRGGVRSRAARAGDHGRLGAPLELLVWAYRGPSVAGVGVTDAAATPARSMAETSPARTNTRTGRGRPVAASDTVDKELAKARRCVERGQDRRALRSSSPARGPPRREGEIQVLLALTHSAAGRTKDALKAARRAVSLAPTPPRRTTPSAAPCAPPTNVATP